MTWYQYYHNDGNKNTGYCFRMLNQVQSFLLVAVIYKKTYLLKCTCSIMTLYVLPIYINL